ncbi:hypothetical protein STENM223S_09728 [Streptomyces tendae]
MPEGREHLGGLGPVGIQQAVGERAVLPGVPLPGGETDGAGEEDSPRCGLQLGELFLQAFQSPEVSLLGSGGRPVGGFQGGQAPLEVGHTLFQWFHAYEIT